MEVQKEAFAGLMEYYKLLPLQSKRKEIIDSIENLIVYYTKICTKFGIIPNMTLNKEMLSIGVKDINEEEFLHALFAYINSLQDISAQFIETMCDIVEENSKK